VEVRVMETNYFQNSGAGSGIILVLGILGLITVTSIILDKTSAEESDSESKVTFITSLIVGAGFIASAFFGISPYFKTMTFIGFGFILAGIEIYTKQSSLNILSMLIV
jgi:hypothetical protein